MFIIIVLAAVLGLIATDVFVPSLPSIAAVFHQSLNHTELTISLFLVGFAFSQLFYGPISDRIGRKIPLSIGVCLFMLGSLICVFADSFMMFCLGRIIQGIGVGGGLSLARVIIRDLYSGTNLAVKMSQIGIYVSLAPALAPFIGGLLQSHFGFRAVFAFLFLYGLVLLGLLLFCFKETIREKEKSFDLSRTFKHYHDLLRNFHFMHYVLIAGFAFSAIILYANVIPFIIQDQMHLSAKTNGEILLLAALGLSVSCLINSRIVQYLEPRKLLAVGLILLTSVGLLLMISEYFFGLSLITLIPLIFIITLACGFMFPNGVALAFHKINVNIGIAGALYGFCQTFTSMIINFILNLTPTQGQMVLGVFYLALGLCGLGLLRIGRKSHLRTSFESS